MEERRGEAVRPGGHSIQPCFSCCFYHALCYQNTLECAEKIVLLVYSFGVAEKVFYFNKKNEMSESFPGPKRRAKYR